MKILLILAADIHYRAEGRMARNRIVNLEPVMLTTLAALVPPELNAEIVIRDEGIQRGSYKGEYYDIVGISACTAAAERAYALCRYWRRKGAHTVLGGIHPSLLPEEAGKWADTVITGGAEISWPVFLKDFAAGKARSRYDQDCSRALSSPVPDRKVAGSGYTPIPSVIANRGCIFPCEFCTIQSLWRQRPHKRPIGEVVDEIKSLGTKYVILLDPGPSSDPEYARELYEAFRSIKVWWACQSTVDTGFDPDLLELMHQSGCIAAFVGFETFGQSGLDGFHKKWNRVDRYKEAVTNFHEKGITIVGGFMMGFDHDTKESLEEMPRLIQEAGIDFPRAAILTPYPGTPFFDEIKKSGRLHHEKWHLYDGFHSVYRPANMTSRELEALFHKTWYGFFSPERMAQRIIGNKTMPKPLYLAINLGIRKFVRRVRTFYGRPYDSEQFLHRY